MAIADPLAATSVAVNCVLHIFSLFSGTSCCTRMVNRTGTLLVIIVGMLVRIGILSCISSLNRVGMLILNFLFLCIGRVLVLAS